MGRQARFQGRVLKLASQFTPELSATRAIQSAFRP